MYIIRYLIFQIALYVYKHCGSFLFKKNSGLKFLKFHVPNGTVQSGTIRLHRPDPSHRGFGYLRKSGTGGNNFVKWIGTFRSDRPKRADRSKWTTFVDHLQKGSQIFHSDRTEMVHSIWFRTEISGILRWIESALCVLKWKEKKGVIARAVTPLAWHAIACLQRAKDG